MNILFYCNEYPPYPCGGIGIFTKELAEELALSGHKVIVFGIYSESVNEKINGVEIVRVKGIKRFGFVLNRLVAYFHIKEIIKNKNIDLMEVQDFTGPIAFFPKLNTKIVSRLHGSVYYFSTLLNDSNKIKSKIWKIIENRSLKNSDVIVSVSDFTAEKTRSIFNIKQDITTIHNGVVIGNRAIKEGGENIIFTYAGSIIRKKGIVELCRAWDIFSKDKKNVELHVFGKDIEGLVDKLKKEELCNKIYFHGPVQKSELIEFYNRTDFCIYPTKAEAFSLAPMEAMSLGKFVLYTNQTSANELVDHLRDGFLIPECDVTEIYNSLEFVFNMNSIDVKNIEEAARNKIIGKFQVKKLLAVNERFYSDLLNIK